MDYLSRSAATKAFEHTIKSNTHFYNYTNNKEILPAFCRGRPVIWGDGAAGGAIAPLALAPYVRPVVVHLRGTPRLK